MNLLTDQLQNSQQSKIFNQQYKYLPYFTNMIIIPAVFVIMLNSVAVSQTSVPFVFNINDQFDVSHTESEYLGHITIIIGSNKDGSEFNPIWSKAIHDTLGVRINNSKINIVPVADVSSVSFFFKGFVKSKFRDERKDAVLLDWEGFFSNAYQFENGASNIIILDKSGNLVYKTNGKALDNEKLKIICSKIINLDKLSQ